MALDLNSLKKKYKEFLGSDVGKTLSSVGNVVGLAIPGVAGKKVANQITKEGYLEKLGGSAKSLIQSAPVQSGLKGAFPITQIGPMFTREPGYFGELDPGSLAGAWGQAYKSGNPEDMRQINIDLALDIMPGVAGVTKAKNAGGLLDGGGDIVNKYKTQISAVTKDTKSLKQTLGDFYTNWVNRTQPVEDLEKTVEKTINAKIRPEFSPTYAIKQLFGAGGKAELRHNQVLKPILDSVGDVPKEDFDVFLKAQRDMELAQRGIKGSDFELANKVVNELGLKYDINRLTEAANKLYAYQRDNLQALKEAGFLSDEAVEAIERANQKYVPFNRIMEQVNDYIGLPTSKMQQSVSPVKKIKGSERAIESPVESIIANTYRTEAAIAKNRVAKSIVGLKEVLPTLPINPSKQAEGAITVWENGKKLYYKVPQDIERVVKGLNEETMDTLTKVLSAPARLLRQQATGRNLEFMIPNAFRDQFDAAINSKYGYKPFVGYLQGLAHLINFNRTGSDEIVEGWINSGGKMFFENMSGMKAVSSQVSDSQRRSFIKKLGEWVVGGIEKVGEYSEVPTRLGLYENALRKTGNPLVAGLESREATLDFARRGAKMKTANALVPFLNVGVQGFDRMVRTVKDNPAKAGLAVLAYGAVPSTAVAIFNNAFHGDDWQLIPDYIKQDNFVIMTGGKDADGNPTYVTLPKSHIQKFVANPVQEFITYMAGNNPQGFQQFALNFFGESLPVVEGGSTFGEAVSKTVGSNLPQAVKVPAQLTANYDFFRGKQIVPWYLDDKPKPEQTTKYTEGVYNKIGQVLNVSPLKVKNALETTLAGGITQPVNLYKTLDALVNGAKVTPQDLFITRRFFNSAAGYDIERPQGEENAQSLAQRLMSPTSQASAAGGLPTIPADFEVLYEDAVRTIDGYKENSAKIRTGLKTNQTLEEAQAELVSAKNLIQKMETEQPDMVIAVGLKTYSSDGSKKVEERAIWAKKWLESSKDEQEFSDRYKAMLDGGVITKSVLETLNELGVRLPYYTSGGKIKSYGSGGGSKKKIVTPKIPSYTPKKITVKSIKPDETKIVTPAVTVKSSKPSKEFNPSFRRDKILATRVKA